MMVKVIGVVILRQISIDHCSKLFLRLFKNSPPSGTKHELPDKMSHPPLFTDMN